MYRVALEGLLGLRRQGETFYLEPCIPTSWKQYEIDWRHQTSRYHIIVRNPEHRSSGVAAVTVDGLAVPPAAIPLLDDGREHEVVVMLGSPTASAPTLAEARAPQPA